jgi:hypothetical protein
MVLGASFANISLFSEEAKGTQCASQENPKLNKVRAFWFENFYTDPEDYLVSNKISEQSFKKINKKELENGKILKFQGVYFSYCELALIASLAPISVQNK